MVRITSDFDGVFVEHPLPIEQRFDDNAIMKEADRFSFLRKKPKKITMEVLESIGTDEIIVVTGRPDYERSKIEKWFNINKINVVEINCFSGTPSSTKDVRNTKLRTIKNILPDYSLEDDRVVLENLPPEIGKILIINDSMEIL